MTLLRALSVARSRPGASQLLLRASAPAASALLRVPTLAAAPPLSAPRRWNQQAPAESHIFDEHDARRRQLLYRSKQRGWLEMDIMLGNWARENLQKLGPNELEQYQQIIDMENPDLFRWLTGQEDVPAELGNPLLVKLCEDLKTTMEPKASVKSTAKFEGKVWE